MMRKIVLSLIASLGLCSLALAQNKQVSGTTILMQETTCHKIR